MRLSKLTAIGLAVAIIAASGIGVAAVASRHGLVARYYPNATWSGAPVVERIDERVATELLDQRLAAVGGAGRDDISVRWQGFLRVDQPGDYRFTLISNDVAWLYLDGRLRVNNGTYGSSRRTETVPLTAGLHRLEVAFFSRGGDHQLELLWARGAERPEPIPASGLFPTQAAWRAYDALWGQAYLWPLAGSLVLGFLELQASQAQNRFYNDLEDWLSSYTRLSGGTLSVEGGDQSVPAYVSALLEQTADSLDELQRTLARGEDNRASSSANILSLTERLATLTDQMRTEQDLMVKLVENQMEMRPVLERLAERGGQPTVLDEASRSHLRSLDVYLGRLLEEMVAGREQSVNEIRAEFKLLARTIAAVAENERRDGRG